MVLCLETLWSLEVLWNRFWILVEGIPGFVGFVDYRIQFGGTYVASGPLWPVSTGIVSNNLAIGAEQLRDRYFFVSDKADGYFVNSPRSGALVFLLRRILGNRGLEIIKYMCKIWVISLYMPEN